MKTMRQLFIVAIAIVAVVAMAFTSTSTHKDGAGKVSYDQVVTGNDIPEWLVVGQEINIVNSDGSTDHLILTQEIVDRSVKALIDRKAVAREDKCNGIVAVGWICYCCETPYYCRPYACPE